MQDFDKFEDELLTGLRDWVDETLASTKVEALKPEWLSVNENSVLGEGAYGIICEASLVGGPWSGMSLVVKRARTPSELDAVAAVAGLEDVADSYLNIEAKINEEVSRDCPGVAAAYVGSCTKDGILWLCWCKDGTQTLEDALNDADWVESVSPLAKALKLPQIVGQDPSSLRHLAEAVALQLLSHCEAMAKAGICHRCPLYASLVCGALHHKLRSCVA